MSYIQILLIFVAILIAVVIWRYPRRRVILTHAIALQTMAEPDTIIIPAGVTLPYFFSDLFRNAEDGQERIVITLFQTPDGGERKIDVITLDELPPRPVGMLELEIRLMLGRNKRLKVIVKSDDAKLLKTFGPYRVE